LGPGVLGLLLLVERFAHLRLRVGVVVLVLSHPSLLVNGSSGAGRLPAPSLPSRSRLRPVISVRGVRAPRPAGGSSRARPGWAGPHGANGGQGYRGAHGGRGGGGTRLGAMYTPAPDRYDRMPMRRAGRSGLDLPAISLGLWQNFGDDTPLQRQRDIILHAVDHGITQIDLANNYGPPAGSAESNFGRVLRTDLAGLRDELVITTKAGYDMW